MHRTIVFPVLLASTVPFCRPAVDRGIAPSFPDFLVDYRSAHDANSRREVLSRFWSSVLLRGTPLTRPGDSSAVFLYRGPADSVRIVGDMTRWTDPVTMLRLEGSDLFHVSLTFPYDARVDYRIVIDGGNGIVDPANPHTVMGGYGNNSELAMPEFQRAEETAEHPGIARGSLVTLTHRSAILEYEHTVHVYVPAGYAESTDRYPVAYFQDGQDYLTLAGARTILDNLIAEGSIRPVMAVFVVPPASPQRSRRNEYAMNDAYVKFLVSELVPHIDSTYRTLRRAGQRLVIGPSSGGLISLYAGFCRPDVFGSAASQSGFVSFEHDSLITLFRLSTRKPLRVYADIGTYETAVGPARCGDENFLAGNRRLREVLEAEGYGATYREFHDGHSWGRWRNELPFILRLFFPWTR